MCKYINIIPQRQVDSINQMYYATSSHSTNIHLKMRKYFMLSFSPKILMKQSKKIRIMQVSLSTPSPGCYGTVSFLSKKACVNVFKQRYLMHSIRYHRWPYFNIKTGEYKLIFLKIMKENLENCPLIPHSTVLLVGVGGC